MLFRIYRFELGKIFSRKYIVAAILGVIAIMVGSILYYKQWNGNLIADYNKFKSWEGPYTTQVQQKLDDLQRTDFNGMYQDKTIYAVQQSASNATSYQMYVTRATQAMATDNPGTYQYRVDAMHEDKLKEHGTPQIRYTGAWGQVFQVMNYQGYIYLGALLVLGVSTVFSSEFSTNVFSTLRSAKHGRRKLVTAKLAAVMTFAVTAALGVTTLNVGVTGLLFGFHGWNTPLTNLYPDTPYHITIGQHVLMQYGLCLVGCVAFSVFISLLSLISRSSMVTLFISYTLLFVPSFLYSSLGQDLHWVKILCTFSYTEMMQVAPYVQWFVAMNWFGNPVLPMNYAVATQILLSILFIVLLYRRFGRTEAA